MTIADRDRVDRYADSCGDVAYESLDVGPPVERVAGADVYETTATVDGETRAVSVVRPRLQGPLADATATYVDGVRAWASVDDHEGVCSVLDWGATEDGPWVVTERVDGDTLRDRLDEGAFVADEALGVTTRCARVLEHLHDNRVHHHALTPERIRLDDGDPVVLDIGTGAALDERAGGFDALTTTYAAPEQFNPSQFGDPDERTDVYRLGVVCYELLTGRRPYDGDDATVVESVTDPTVTPEAPSEYADLPAGVDEVVTTALATDPADRYRTAEAFRVALRELREEPVDAAWRQFGGGPAHSHQEPRLGPTAPVEQYWTVDTGYHEVQSAPVVVDGTVYVGGNDDAVHAIDVTSGNHEWSVELPQSIATTPAVADETVFVTSGDTLSALDAATGEKRWTFTADRFRTSPVVADDTVYVTNNDAFVYALDAETGRERWRFETGSALAAPPAVADGAVYVGGTDQSVYALDAETGTERWRRSDGLSKVKTAPVVRYGRVYVVALGGTVHALDADDGRHVWQTDTDARALAAPAVDGGTVFVGGDMAGLTALDADTGAETWTFAERDTTTSPVVADGVVYLGTDTGIYGVDADTGDELWTLDLGEAVTTAPGLGETDLFVGGADGDVLSVRGADSATPTPEFGTCGGDVTMPAIERLQSPAGGWATASAAPARTRHAGGGGPTDDAATRWEFDPNAPLSPPSMDDDGVVYVGDDRATLHAVDSGEGDVLWTAADVADDAHEVVTAGDRVYAVCQAGQGDGVSSAGDDEMSALEADTGEVRWSVEGTGEFRTPTVAGDVLYALDERELHALSTADGECLWREEMAASHTPVVGHGTVYLAGGGTLTALDAGLGIEQWTVEIPRHTVGVPALANEHVYLATDGGDVLAVDAEAGTETWRVSPAEEFRTGVAVDAETVYCAGSDGTVTALDAASGDTRWRQDIDSGVRHPLAVADAVYVPARAGTVALDATDGEVCWERTTSNRGYVLGPAVGDGRLAVVDETRTLRTMVPGGQVRSADDTEPETVESDLDRDDVPERGDEHLSIAVEQIADPEDPTDEELRAAILGCLCDEWLLYTQQVIVSIDDIAGDVLDRVPGATEPLLDHNCERLAEKGYVGWDATNSYTLLTLRPSAVQAFEDATGEAVIKDTDLMEVLEPLYEQTRQSRDPRLSREELRERTYLEDDELDRIIWYLANVGKWVEDVLIVTGTIGYVDIHATGQTPWVTAKLNGAGKELYEDIS